jgi:hypothetical protein
VAEQQIWIPSNGWFVFLAFVGLGFVGSYFTGRVQVMIGISLIGAFVVASLYRGKM